MKILSLEQVKQLVSIPAVIQALEEGFVTYSRGEAVIPPVASLQFEYPVGDCHIKYGYAKYGKYYVVKVASGFPDNSRSGLPSGNGLILLFNKTNGQLLSILLDQGYLTDIRTAAAGCIVAKYLAPKNISCIGIVGLGAQAYYQLKLLEFFTTSRKTVIWGRNEAKANKFKAHPDLVGWEIKVAADLNELTAECNLIVTTTSSSKSLIFANQIRPGTHITALGADDFGKQELDPEVFAKADRIIVDSFGQCKEFGDVSYAIKQNLVSHEQLLELGNVIETPSLRRQSEAEITVADLTGVAIQDLQIAKIVYEQSFK